jgi:2-polyprenyl-6-methoxyphenol hydroxylase-like FAD-dependent oxidoreductase
LVQAQSRVTAVTVRRDGRDDQIETDLVVVCNGRSSALRKALGSQVTELQRPSSLLWLRFDLTNQSHPLPETLDGFVMRRGFYVLYPTYGRRVQLMWRRNRNAQLDWKSPVAILKEALLSDAPPHWRVFFELFNETTERQQLSVVCDRLARWWAPGVLFLGDAAHTMSPVGAQGLNVAIRDAIVASNHLIRAHRAGQPFSDTLLAGIEAERRPEIEHLQAFQVRAGRIFDAPPPVQWLMANVVISTATHIQGASYLRQLQFGVTDVRMEYPSPIQPTALPVGVA